MIGILRRFGVGRRQPTDPLAHLLSGIPVPLAEAGHWTDRFVRIDAQTGLTQVTDRGDRELGAIAQYGLTLSLAREALSERLLEDRAFAWRLRQIAVLLSDGDAAARWLADRSVKFRDHGGREIDGTRYGQIDLVPLAEIGDEAQMLISPQERRGVNLVETYVLFRRGRLFGNVDASTFKDFDVRNQLQDLARRLVTRMDDVAR